MTLALDVKGYSQLNKSINSAAVKDKTGRAKRVNSRIYGGIKNPAEDYPPAVDGALSACYSCFALSYIFVSSPPVRERSAAEWCRR